MGLMGVVPLLFDFPGPTALGPLPDLPPPPTLMLVPLLLFVLLLLLPLNAPMLLNALPVIPDPSFEDLLLKPAKPLFLDDLLLPSTKSLFLDDLLLGLMLGALPWPSSFQPSIRRKINRMGIVNQASIATHKESVKEFTYHRPSRHLPMFLLHPPNRQPCLLSLLREDFH
jgi:hypothetical protein